MQLLSMGKFARLIGLSISTLRRLHMSGELIPYYISKGGARYYTEQQLDNLKGDRRVLSQESQNNSDS